MGKDLTVAVAGDPTEKHRMERKMAAIAAATEKAPKHSISCLVNKHKMSKPNM